MHCRDYGMSFPRNPKIVPFHLAGRADRLTFVVLQKPSIIVRLLAQMLSITKHSVLTYQ